MTHDTRLPTIAVLDELPLVTAGLRALVGAEFEIVELTWPDALAAHRTADVVLVDPETTRWASPDDVRSALGRPECRVVAFTVGVQAEEINGWLAEGGAGFLWKGLAGRLLSSALTELATGRGVVAVGPTTAVARPHVDPPAEGLAGLSEREVEVIAMVTQGMSNAEIAHTSYLSINTVKTYVRTAYRKMGVSSRSGAVLWGIRHGLLRQEETRDAEAGADPDRCHRHRPLPQRPGGSETGATGPRLALLH
jgi:two-component system, NarL family, response regulator LiaR